MEHGPAKLFQTESSHGAVLKVDGADGGSSYVYVTDDVVVNRHVLPDEVPAGKQERKLSIRL